MENINKVAALPPTTVVKFVYPEAGTTVQPEVQWGHILSESRGQQTDNKRHIASHKRRRSSSFLQTRSKRSLI